MNALIVAREASGDLYGGELATALFRRNATLVLAGMGGPRMKAAGVKLLYNYSDVAVVGVFEVASKLKHLRLAYARLKDWIVQNRPDFAVLIDFPDFNFRIAKFLKQQGVKVFYFISPQVWAWRKRRIFFLKKHIDLMICILPFEQKLYEEAGVKAVYVGHPLVEIVKKEVATEKPYPRGTQALIGIMPGSREIEMRRHLPVLTETVSRIKEKIALDAVVLWPPSLDINRYNIPEFISAVFEHRYSAMQACDLLLVASGTSTLESAILGAPLFIVYRVGSVSWQLGKALVRVPYYGLVNWIAERKCIPEYIQDRMDPLLLSSDALQFLADNEQQDRMREELSQIVEALGPPGAIDRAADLILP